MSYKVVSVGKTREGDISLIHICSISSFDPETFLKGIKSHLAQSLVAIKSPQYH